MANYVFGVDVGGTTVKLGLFDVSGNLEEKWEIPTRTENGGKAILPDIAASVLAKLKEKGIDKEEVSGIGIGVPGPINAEGTVPHTANLGWGYKEVTKELQELTGLICKGGNDANVAALGEMWKGAAAGHKSGVMVTLGTGVGGGIIIEGRIIAGTNGAGGEIGHIHVEDNETECCNCGNKGCLEQYASATGITRLANKKLKESDKESILRGGEVSAKTVFDAVKEKDELAMEVADEFGRYLGNALAVIAGVVNPDAIVIGGGVSKAGEILMDYIKPYYEKNVFHGSRDVKFSLATLGNDAGIYGAAKLMLDIK